MVGCEDTREHTFQNAVDLDTFIMKCFEPNWSVFDYKGKGVLKKKNAILFIEEALSEMGLTRDISQEEFDHWCDERHIQTYIDKDEMIELLKECVNEQ